MTGKGRSGNNTFQPLESSPFILGSDGSLVATVDLRLYGQEALLRAAHRFTDRCHLQLQTRDEHAVTARFRAKNAQTGDLVAVAGEFFNELLDCRLRALVQRESEPVRNLILAHALSRTSLVDAGTLDGDPAPAARNADPDEVGPRTQVTTTGSPP